SAPAAGGAPPPGARVPVARFPPVVPHACLDHGRLALAQDARLPVTLQGQFSLEHGEALDESRMVVLADDPRPNERRQLGGRAALTVHVGKLEDRCTLTRDGVLPDLADLDRCEVWRAVRVGV